MRVTSLIENSCDDAARDLMPEFGLSMLVEHGGAKLLFDMGATPAFADNAERMGIDISSVDAAVVSHQHFDHGGGLAHFLETNTRARIFLRDAPLASRYFKLFPLRKRSIGLDANLCDRFKERIEWVGETTEIAPDVFLVTEIGSSHRRPRGNRRLFVDRDGSLQPDSFDHELVMVVRDHDGLVVFSGCSHSGVLNLVDAATAALPGRPVKALFGGFHLIGLPFFDSMAATRAEVTELGREILERVTGPVFTGHCTGAKAFPILQDAMGPRLNLFPTGATAEV